MRRVDKDLNDIPRSLRVDAKSLLKGPAKTTNERRIELIRERRYPKAVSSTKYDARYRMPDIKDQLKLIYHGKCAYCETPAEQMVVEHYRPKRGGYYWLAFSWDNLLLACPKCNEYKGDSFPVLRGRVAYDSSRDEISQIHQLGALYDNIEMPLVVNPERALPTEINSIFFNREGQIFSNNTRMQQTITTCKLDRKALCESRKKVWDDLCNEIKLAVALAGKNKEVFRVRLSQVLASFVLRSNDPKSNYTSFRQFILKHKEWISEWILFLISK